MPIYRGNTAERSLPEEPYIYCDTCGRGGYFLFSQDDDADAPWVCERCYHDVNNPPEPEADPFYGDEYRDPAEEEVSSDDPSSPGLSLLIPAIEGRPTRLVSVEQEVGKGGRLIAQDLFAAGLSPYSRMEGYHSGSGGFSYVESDATVDGEIIWSRMDLSTHDHAHKFRQGLELVRKRIRTDEVKLDMRCGLHIHVGLQGYAASSVVSLYHLWNHLEDTIFRLASANWKAHRTEIASDNYAPKTWKAERGLEGIARNQMERGALNLSNYLGARARCRCGAFDFGLWEECRCDLPKPTVEFRVFNGSANPRKIRGYIALCLAMVAFADEHKVNPESFPVFEWSQTDTSGWIDYDGWKSQSVKRMEFILDELPLTTQEKTCLVYCADRSSLATVVQELR